MTNMKNLNQWSRREFVRMAAGAALTAGSVPRVVRGAATGKPLKAGLVGCGGRGTQACQNAMTADANLKVIALADMFQDRLQDCRNTIKDMTAIEDKYCFTGLDAYKKLLQTDIDYVILATPPYYRPEHLAACIAAGKHVFMEKPVAVDPVGARKIMETGKLARQKNLSIVAGTQRRHHPVYIETIKRLHDGAIGRILAGQIYWNGGQAWYKKREPGWSDQEWLIRDWNNWAFMSGDHIVEQHVHNIDIACWALKSPPEKALAMGGRLRRLAGDMYDFFCTDFTFPENVHILSQCRQINGVAKDVSEHVMGEKGQSNCNGWITGTRLPKSEVDPYVQEHVDLIAAIRKGEPINEAQNVAESTLAGIMARISAYTGQEVTWDDMLDSNLVLSAPDYPLTEENIRAHIPVPGTSESAPKKKKQDKPKS
jgi:myo-inositol 2-dehydrogenase / D-chiro-inositol 1-dehydrogenase